MIDLLLDTTRKPGLRVLCIGAHCDDIEIGCGGTLLELQGRAVPPTIDWVVLSGTAERRAETRSAMQKLVRPASRGELLLADFPDGRFPAVYSPIKDFLESLKRRPGPDLIFCHERNDRHQDHRIVSEMVWNTFRDHLILEYEIPKWDGGLGVPNVYVPVSSRHAMRKADWLLASHRSQAGRGWFSHDTFMSLLRLRGVECRSPSGYAEAFHGRKIRLGGR
jgi:LmbE family N-acetylglucosaminyl deacetylase